MLRPRDLTRTGFDTPAAVIEGWDGQISLPVETYPRGRRPSGGLANCTAALPEIARLLSDLQYPLTGDDLTTEIDAFAA